MTRWNDVDLLHPIMRPAVLRLSALLEEGFRSGATLTYFQLFETYRSPKDQDDAHGRGTSKARAWQSPHQYGFAADFVPFGHNGWNWDAHNDWDFLRARAVQCGLNNRITWDRPHVEHPDWEVARARIRTR